MATKGHEVLQEESTDSSDDQLPDNRISAYNEDESEGTDENDAAIENANIQLETIGAAVVDTVLPTDDTGDEQNEHKTQQNEIVGSSDQAQQEQQSSVTQSNNNYNYTTGTTFGRYSQFNSSMYRIMQLLNMSTTIFLLYLCLVLNGIFFFIGALSNTRNLGNLWFRADYDIEYEYSFGWHKSVELEGDWTPVGYKDLDGYFDTGIVGAGEFFATTTILGLVFLIILAIIAVCQTAKNTVNETETVSNNNNNNNNKIKTVNQIQTENRNTNIYSGVILGLSLIFFLVYVISLLTFHSEFEDVCGQLIGLLDSAHKYYYKQDLDHYECDDGWAMYVQYVNILVYVLSMVLYYEVRKGRISMQIAKQIKYSMVPNRNNIGMP